MRKAHQVLAGLIAALVVVQAMAIAYAMAGLAHWVDKDGGVLNKQVLDSWEKHAPTWQGSGGFALHGIDGMMIIPVVTIAFLVVSLLAAKQVAGAGKRAAILFGMVVVQVVLGLSAHDVVVLAPLHALNGLGIFAMAMVTVRKAAAVPAAAPVAAAAPTAAPVATGS
jgi:hypothetical protein